MRITILVELEEVAALVKLLHNELFADTPPCQLHETVIKDEASLLLNLLLSQCDDTEYLDELTCGKSIEDLLASFWDKRQWRAPFLMNLRPREFSVKDTRGLTTIIFEGF